MVQICVAKTVKVIYYGNMFLRLISYILLYYRIEPQNSSELLAELVLHNKQIKIEKLFRTHNGLKRVSTISQILLEILESC